MSAADDQAFRDWVAKARARPTLEVAERLGFRPDPKASSVGEKAGPCPACGGRDRFSVVVAKGARQGLFHCRGCGVGGKDGLGLMIQAGKRGFLAACEELTGEPPPGRGGGEVGGRAAPAARRVATEDEARAQGRAAWSSGHVDSPYGPADPPGLLKAWMAGYLEARDADRAELERRGSERGRAYDLWRQAGPIAESPVARYLAFRGLGRCLLWKLKLRCHPDLPFWHDGREIGRAPAMLAAMQRNDGRFGGLHITWLRPDGEGKAVFATGDGEVLPAKKMRGEKKGCHIEVLPAVGPPERLVIAEGIENVLSAMLMMEGGALWPRTAWWTSCDLANMGGPSRGSVPHPTATATRTDREGRTPAFPRMVSGPDPAERPDWPAIAPPKTARIVIPIGDGDSDPFATRSVIERARRRWTALGHEVRPVFADDGMDLNDMWRARLAAAAASEGASAERSAAQSAATAASKDETASGAASGRAASGASGGKDSDASRDTVPA